MLQKKMLEEEDLDYVLKDKTFLAMLNLQMNRYETATDVAAQAISLADNIREERTLPSYIWALSILADPDRECTSDVIEALRVAYCHEPDNILIPIMTGSCMDRLMYRYHYGRLSIDQLSLFYRVITDSRLDEELSAASLEIFVTRCLIELKRTKQDIFIEKTVRPPQVADYAAPDGVPGDRKARGRISERLPDRICTPDGVAEQLLPGS